MGLTREWPSFPPWEGVEYGCPTLSPKEGIIVVTYDVVPPGEGVGLTQMSNNLPNVQE